MKRIFSLAIVVCMSIFCLASCASMENFKKNLEKDYDIIETADYADIDDLADEMYLEDIDDYDVKKVMFATHEDNGRMIYIIECGSNAKADKLLKDMDDAIEEIDNYYSFKVDAVVKGSFVLAGAKSAIEDALGE